LGDSAITSASGFGFPGWFLLFFCGGGAEAAAAGGDDPVSADECLSSSAVIPKKSVDEDEVAIDSARGSSLELEEWR
jgi:hypothetical protein